MWRCSSDALGALWRFQLRYLWRWLSWPDRTILVVLVLWPRPSGAVALAPLMACALILALCVTIDVSNSVSWLVPSSSRNRFLSQTALIAVMGLVVAAMPVSGHLVMETLGSGAPLHRLPMLALNLWTCSFAFGLAVASCNLSLWPPWRAILVVIVLVPAAVLIGAHVWLPLPVVFTVVQIGVAACCLYLFWTAHASLEAHPPQEPPPTVVLPSAYHERSPYPTGSPRRPAARRGSAPSGQPDGVLQHRPGDPPQPQAAVQPGGAQPRPSYGSGRVLRRLVLVRWPALLAAFATFMVMLAGNFLLTSMVLALYVWSVLSPWAPLAFSPFPRRRAFAVMFVPALILVGTGCGLKLFMARDGASFKLFRPAAPVSVVIDGRERLHPRFRLRHPRPFEEGALLQTIGHEIKLGGPLPEMPDEAAAQIQAYLRLVHGLDLSVERLLAYHPAPVTTEGWDLHRAEWLADLRQGIGPLLHRSLSIRITVDQLLQLIVVLAAIWAVLHCRRLNAILGWIGMVPALSHLLSEAQIFRTSFVQGATNLYVLAVAYPLPVLGSLVLVCPPLFYRTYRAFRLWLPLAKAHSQLVPALGGRQ